MICRSTIHKHMKLNFIPNDIVYMISFGGSQWEPEKGWIEDELKKAPAPSWMNGTVQTKHVAMDQHHRPQIHSWSLHGYVNLPCLKTISFPNPDFQYLGRFGIQPQTKGGIKCYKLVPSSIRFQKQPESKPLNEPNPSKKCACPSVSSSPSWKIGKNSKKKQVLPKKAPSKAVYQAFHADLFRFRSTKLIKTAKESKGAHPQHHPHPRNNASLRTIIVTIVPWESPNKALFSRVWVAFGRLPLDSHEKPWQGHWSPSVTLSSPETATFLRWFGNHSSRDGKQLILCETSNTNLILGILELVLNDS